jgi:hypothetical protein
MIPRHHIALHSIRTELDNIAQQHDDFSSENSDRFCPKEGTAIAKVSTAKPSDASNKVSLQPSRLLLLLRSCVNPATPQLSFNGEVPSSRLF